MVITTPEFDVALASLRDELTKSTKSKEVAYHNYLLGLSNLCLLHGMTADEFLRIVASEMTDAWSLINLLETRYEEAEFQVERLKRRLNNILNKEN